jgi:hypothetical protein
MRGTDLPASAWRKSSFSGSATQNCVEVATIAAVAVAVRNSRDPGGPALRFTTAEWVAFLHGVRAGEFGSTNATSSDDAAYPGSKSAPKGS